ncbi:MAG: hypothetical protein HZB19_00775 [Chloroflexi bacterium]|nr:hypothetical protein [Chloroflexota bacterium]
MGDPIIVASDDAILKTLDFQPYRSIVERRVFPFLPEQNQPQTIDVTTPWGAQLTAKSGDLLVSEVDKPDDIWPVDAEIFEQTYMIIRPGFCIKRALTMLVPLTSLTDGDEDQMVTVQTLEGPETVRAGDFYLAKGVKGEIWPYPKEKVEAVMIPAE